MIGEDVMKYALIPVAAIISASAQILLKKGAGYPNWTREWILFVLASGAVYVVSLFLYMYLLRLHPISRIYPVLTVLVILIITAYGFLTGERVSWKQLAGLALGAGSIYLMFA
jgi:drug/metabolite transporter (DMT)-like permease